MDVTAASAAECVLYLMLTLSFLSGCAIAGAHLLSNDRYEGVAGLLVGRKRISRTDFNADALIRAYLYVGLTAFSFFLTEHDFNYCGLAAAIIGGMLAPIAFFRVLSSR